MGAYSNNVSARGPWSVEEQGRHINELELLGAFNAIRPFANFSTRIHIRLFLDNNTAVCYVYKQGGTKSGSLTKIAKDLAKWCEDRSISIEALFLPGKLNVDADRESRAIDDSSDWKLSSLVFTRICSIWSCRIDLFAKAWNAQLPLFVSWNPQPEALAIDAFSINWQGRSVYAFPPFSLISRCLSKLRRERATIIMVCPVWNSQPWFPLLLELACDRPRILPQDLNLLSSPTGDPHPLSKSHLLLAAWKLSGDLSLGKAFRNKLLSSCWPETVRLRTWHTNQLGETGTIGVWEGIAIPWKMI